MNVATTVAGRGSWLALAAALPWLAIAALWLLMTHYRGLDHDALLYTFQAIAHLRPELYSGDVFLRHGSQDNFSAFAAIYSRLVGWLGVESAAAWTTLCATIALQFAAWRLARRLLPASLALMGLALLIVLPTDYGPYGIFHVLEPFLTSRMPAEALAVCAIISILSARRLLALALLIASACMHPLMAAPAALVVAYLALPASRRWMLPVASGVGLVLLCLIGSLHAIDAFRVDDAWREFFDDYAAYLFITNWRVSDGMTLCPAVLTLVLGAGVLAQIQARQLCAAVLLAGMLGLAIMAIGGDWLRIALVVQGQGYRWFWPSTLVSLLVLPGVVAILWRRGSTGRAAVLALAALWLVPLESFGPIVAVAAALTAGLALHDRLAPAHARWVLVGAALMLALAIFFSLGDRVMTSASPYSESYLPDFLDRLHVLFLGGLIPVLVLIAVFALAHEPAQRFAHAVVALTLVCACAWLLPVNFAAWARRDFNPQVIAAFASWRALIPVGSEVAWVEKPEFVWLLLERPSYYSVQQSLSGVFTRAAALDMLARGEQLVPLIKADDVKGTLGFVGEKHSAVRPAARTLGEVCGAIDARFVVSRVAFTEAALAGPPAGAPPGFRLLHLYLCKSHST